MSETRINVTGGKALIAIAVLIIIAGIQFVRLQTMVDDTAKDALRIRLYMEYGGTSSKLIEQAKQEGPQSESVEQLLKHTQDLDTIAITSFKARKSGKDVVVRVEFTIDGNPQKTRYFIMEPSLIGQRKVKRETSVLWYYATFW